MSKTMELVRMAHSVFLSSTEDKKPSPWFGEVYGRFAALWANEMPGKLCPDRPTVIEVMRSCALPFRMSGDYSEDYRTIYYNPTDFDKRTITRLVSKKLAIVDVGADRNQMSLFQIQAE